MREVLRDPARTDGEVARFFMHVVERKPEMHEFRENYQPGRRMIAIGG
jgi:cyclic pyranopterin phosphate synthase